MARIAITGMLMLVMGAAIASADATVSYDNAKTLGMGNARVAGGYGYNGFIYNPALLARVRYLRVSILTLPITVNKNISDIAQFISDNQEQFETFSDLSLEERQQFVEDLREHDSKWGRLNVAPLIDISTNIAGFGIGAAVFNGTEIGLSMDEGIYEPRVWGQGLATTTAVVGVSKSLSMLYPGLTVGANLKYINRRDSGLFQIPASDLGNIGDTIDPIIDKIQDQTNTSIAVDLGGLLELPVIDAEVGASVQSIGTGRGASVDLGISKRLLGDHLLVAADYIDALDNNKENVFSKIRAGAEYKAAFLALRAGLNGGYPTVGLGLNFRIIDIDTAYYSQDLTKGPGGNEEQRGVVQIKVGW